MISVKRIITIFRTRGGGDGCTGPAAQLVVDQVAYFAGIAEQKPIIAHSSSQDEWFVITESLLACSGSGGIIKIHFEEIDTVVIPKPDMLNPRIKIEGGNLDVGLRDGTSRRVRITPGGPYFGLMNILMAIAKTNGKSGEGLVRQRRTINDQRPSL